MPTFCRTMNSIMNDVVLFGIQLLPIILVLEGVRICTGLVVVLFLAVKKSRNQKNNP